jgi:hypothetical protein
MTTTTKFQFFTTIILIGFIVALFFHAVLTFLKFGYPFNTFLFQPWDRFNDFLILFDISKDLNPYAHPTNYLPLAYLLYYPFTWLGNPSSALMIFLELFCCFMFWNANFYLQKSITTMPATEYLKSLVILCLLTYPTLFGLDRANLDMLVFIFIALFFITFIKELYLVAALLLAVAISMKGFPAIFIVLFLKCKNYVGVVLCLIFTALLTLLALVCFKIGVFGSLHSLQNSGQALIQSYVINDNAMTSSISLFSFVKVLLKYYYLATTGTLVDVTYRAAITSILPYYNVLTIIIFMMVTFYILAVENVLWKQAMLLSAMLALLPIMSGDYRLIFLYAPLLLFLAESNNDKSDYIYTLFFGLLFIPKNFFMLPHTVIYAFECFATGPCGIIPVGGYSVMSMLNIILLFSFMGVIIFSGLKKYSRQK